MGRFSPAYYVQDGVVPRTQIAPTLRFIEQLADRYDLPISNTVAFAQLGGLISDALYETKRSFSSNGQLLSVTPALKRLLQDAGSQEVQQAVWFINFSAGKPAHADLCQKLSQTYRLVQPFLIRTGVTTAEAVEQTYQQMLSEMQSDDFCAGAFSLTVWGTRP